MKFMYNVFLVFQTLVWVFFTFFTYYTLFLQCTFVEQNSFLADKERGTGLKNKHVTQQTRWGATFLSAPVLPPPVPFSPSRFANVWMQHSRNTEKMQNKDVAHANGPVNTQCEPWPTVSLNMSLKDLSATKCTWNEPISGSTASQMEQRHLPWYPAVGEHNQKRHLEEPCDTIIAPRLQTALAKGWAVACAPRDWLMPPSWQFVGDLFSRASRQVVS